MIYDSIDSLEKYKGLNYNLDCAIEFLLTNDIGKLELGKKIVKDDKVYANIVMCNLSEDKEEIYEVHRKYADLHIVIEGQECIYISETQKNIVTRCYVEVDDYELQKGEWIIKSKLSPRQFLLCLPGEAHAPLLGKMNNNDVVKKIIFKILWNDI